MAMLNYRQHARPGPVEALAFRAAGTYEPALEGLTRAFISRTLIDQRSRIATGLQPLVKGAVERLSNSNSRKERWSYTKKHSFEVAHFNLVMALEARDQGMPDAPDPKLAFAGGLIHDVGKTFLPIALIVKELGVDLFFFSAFQGARLSEAERRVLRDEHISSGTRYVRLFGGGPHIKMMLDMVGLHHVMYNGEDTAVPSYPSHIRGCDLPFHARVAKTADFISAVLPRHYRPNGWISTMDGALAYAITVAGRELDPLAIRCFMTGFYKVGPEQADGIIGRLKHPGGQAGLMDLKGARRYSKDTVCEDREFCSIVASKDMGKIQRNALEMQECIAYFGLQGMSTEMRHGGQINKNSGSSV